ncbi:hypothetical protein AB0M39_14130 [Streptomyces sp. NPDC051907]|uniref:hypothetical protein n=1 Tax=Streptomyces sp. NPDC051907 TaxID=3155284 RepID=UPI00342F49EE
MRPPRRTGSDFAALGRPTPVLVRVIAPGTGSAAVAASGATRSPVDRRRPATFDGRQHLFLGRA